MISATLLDPSASHLQQHPPPEKGPPGPPATRISDKTSSACISRAIYFHTVTLLFAKLQQRKLKTCAVVRIVSLLLNSPVETFPLCDTPRIYDAWRLSIRHYYYYYYFLLLEGLSQCEGKYLRCTPYSHTYKNIKLKRMISAAEVATLSCFPAVKEFGTPPLTLKKLENALGHRAIATRTARIVDRREEAEVRQDLCSDDEEDRLIGALNVLLNHFGFQLYGGVVRDFVVLGLTNFKDVNAEVAPRSDGSHGWTPAEWERHLTALMDSATTTYGLSFSPLPSRCVPGTDVKAGVVLFKMRFPMRTEGREVVVEVLSPWHPHTKRRLVDLSCNNLLLRRREKAIGLRVPIFLSAEEVVLEVLDRKARPCGSVYWKKDTTIRCLDFDMYRRVSGFSSTRNYTLIHPPLYTSPPTPQRFPCFTLVLYHYTSDSKRIPPILNKSFQDLPLTRNIAVPTTCASNCVLRVFVKGDSSSISLNGKPTRNNKPPAIRYNCIHTEERISEQWLVHRSAVLHIEAVRPTDTLSIAMSDRLCTSTDTASFQNQTHCLSALFTSLIRSQLGRRCRRARALQRCGAPPPVLTPRSHLRTLDAADWRNLFFLLSSFYGPPLRCPVRWIAPCKYKVAPSHAVRRVQRRGVWTCLSEREPVQPDTRALSVFCSHFLPPPSPLPPSRSCGSTAVPPSTRPIAHSAIALFAAADCPALPPSHPAGRRDGLDQQRTRVSVTFSGGSSASAEDPAQALMSSLFLNVMRHLAEAASEDTSGESGDTGARQARRRDPQRRRWVEIPEELEQLTEAQLQQRVTLAQQAAQERVLAELDVDTGSGATDEALAAAMKRLSAELAMQVSVDDRCGAPPRPYPRSHLRTLDAADWRNLFFLLSSFYGPPLRCPVRWIAPCKYKVAPSHAVRRVQRRGVWTCLSEREPVQPDTPHSAIAPVRCRGLPCPPIPPAVVMGSTSSSEENDRRDIHAIRRRAEEERRRTRVSVTFSGGSSASAEDPAQALMSSLFLNVMRHLAEAASEDTSGESGDTGARQARRRDPQRRRWVEIPEELEQLTEAQLQQRVTLAQQAAQERVLAELDVDTGSGATDEALAAAMKRLSAELAMQVSVDDRCGAPPRPYPRSHLRTLDAADWRNLFFLLSSFYGPPLRCPVRWIAPCKYKVAPSHAVRRVQRRGVWTCLSEREPVQPDTRALSPIAPLPLFAAADCPAPPPIPPAVVMGSTSSSEENDRRDIHAIRRRAEEERRRTRVSVTFSGGSSASAEDPAQALMSSLFFEHTSGESGDTGARQARRRDPQRRRWVEIPEELEQLTEAQLQQRVTLAQQAAQERVLAELDVDTGSGATDEALAAAMKRLSAELAMQVSVDDGDAAGARALPQRCGAPPPVLTPRSHLRTLDAADWRNLFFLLSSFYGPPLRCPVRWIAPCKYKVAPSHAVRRVQRRGVWTCLSEREPVQPDTRALSRHCPCSLPRTALPPPAPPPIPPAVVMGSTSSSEENDRRDIHAIRRRAEEERRRTRVSVTFSGGSSASAEDPAQALMSSLFFEHTSGESGDTGARQARRRDPQRRRWVEIPEELEQLTEAQLQQRVTLAQQAAQERVLAELDVDTGSGATDEALAAAMKRLSAELAMQVSVDDGDAAGARRCLPQRCGAPPPVLTPRSHLRTLDAADWRNLFFLLSSFYGPPLRCPVRWIAPCKYKVAPSHAVRRVQRRGVWTCLSEREPVQPDTRALSPIAPLPLFAAADCPAPAPPIPPAVVMGSTSSSEENDRRDIHAIRRRAEEERRRTRVSVTFSGGSSASAEDPAQALMSSLFLNVMRHLAEAASEDTSGESGDTGARQARRRDPQRRRWVEIPEELEQLTEAQLQQRVTLAQQAAQERVLAELDVDTGSGATDEALAAAMKRLSAELAMQVSVDDVARAAVLRPVLTPRSHLRTLDAADWRNLFFLLSSFYGPPLRCPVRWIAPCKYKVAPSHAVRRVQRRGVWTCLSEREPVQPDTRALSRHCPCSLPRTALPCPPPIPPAVVMGSTSSSEENDRRDIHAIRRRAEEERRRTRVSVTFSGGSSASAEDPAQALMSSLFLNVMRHLAEAASEDTSGESGDTGARQARRRDPQRRRWVEIPEELEQLTEAQLQQRVTLAQQAAQERVLAELDVDTGSGATDEALAAAMKRLSAELAMQVSVDDRCGAPPPVLTPRSHLRTLDAADWRNLFFLLSSFYGPPLRCPVRWIAPCKYKVAPSHAVRRVQRRGVWTCLSEREPVQPDTRALSRHCPCSLPRTALPPPAPPPIPPAVVMGSTSSSEENDRRDIHAIRRRAEEERRRTRVSVTFSGGSSASAEDPAQALMSSLFFEHTSGESGDTGARQARRRDPQRRRWVEIPEELEQLTEAQLQQRVTLAQQAAQERVLAELDVDTGSGATDEALAAAMKRLSAELAMQVSVDDRCGAPPPVLTPRSHLRTLDAADWRNLFFLLSSFYGPPLRCPVRWIAPCKYKVAPSHAVRRVQRRGVWTCLSEREPVQPDTRALSRHCPCSLPRTALPPPAPPPIPPAVVMGSTSSSEENDRRDIHAIRRRAEEERRRTRVSVTFSGGSSASAEDPAQALMSSLFLNVMRHLAEAASEDTSGESGDTGARQARRRDPQRRRWVEIPEELEQLTEAQLQQRVTLAQQAAQERVLAELDVDTGSGATDEALAAAMKRLSAELAMQVSVDDRCGAPPPVLTPRSHLRTLDAADWRNLFFLLSSFYGPPLRCPVRWIAPCKYKVAPSRAVVFIMLMCLALGAAWVPPANVTHFSYRRGSSIVFHTDEEGTKQNQTIKKKNIIGRMQYRVVAPLLYVIFAAYIASAQNPADMLSWQAAYQTKRVVLLCCYFLVWFYGRGDLKCQPSFLWTPTDYLEGIVLSVSCFISLLRGTVAYGNALLVGPLCSLFPLPALVSAAQGIHITLEATWSETPLLQEALEWAARHGGEFHGLDAKSSVGIPCSTLDAFTLLEMLWNTSKRESIYLFAEGDPALLPTFASPLIYNLTQEQQYKILISSLRNATSNFPFDRPRALSSVASFNTPNDRVTNIQCPDERRCASMSSVTEMQARLEVDLSTRTYSPAVEAHYSLAAHAFLSSRSMSACESVPLVLLYGNGADVPHRLATVQDLLTATKKYKMFDNRRLDHFRTEAWRRELWLGEDPAGFSFLHPYPSSPSLADADMVVVLFGVPLDEETMRWYHAIQNWIFQLGVENQKRDSVQRVFDSTPRHFIRFLFGHMPLSAERRCGAAGKSESTARGRAEKPLFLQGYGTTVDMRSMEYKVTDMLQPTAPKSYYRSRGPEAPENALGGAPRSASTIEGFLFTVLRSRYPSLSVQLDNLADALSSTDHLGDRTTAEEDNVVDLNIVNQERISYGAIEYLYHLWNVQKKDENWIAATSPLDGKALISGTSSTRLEELCQAVFDFPMYAAMFSRIGAESSEEMSRPANKRNSQKRADFMQMERELKALQQHVHPGYSMAFLDGRPLQANEVTSLYAVLSLIRERDAQLERIEEVLFTRVTAEEPRHIPHKDIISSTSGNLPSLARTPVAEYVYFNEKRLAKAVLYIQREVRKAAASARTGGVTPGVSAASGSDFGFLSSRFHIDRDVVFWLNDVEKDSTYQEFSASLRGLRRLAHGSKDGMDMPRRYLFHIVFILDPTTPNGRAGITEILQLLKRGAPIQIGVVLVQEHWGYDASASESLNAESESSDGERNEIRGMPEEEIQERLLRCFREFKSGSLHEGDYERTEKKKAHADAEGSDGAYLLVLETMLYLQQQGNQGGMRGLLEGLDALYKGESNVLDKDAGADSPAHTSNFPKRISKWLGLEKKRIYEKKVKDAQLKPYHKRQKHLKTHLMRFIQSYLDGESDWIIDDVDSKEHRVNFHKRSARNTVREKQVLREEALMNYYHTLRRSIGKFSFSGYPVVLLNGAHLRVETSLLLALQAEAQALWPLVEHGILGDDTPSENFYPIIMQHFHAVRSLHPALSNSIPLLRWRGVTRTHSYIPSLLTFLQSRSFLIAPGGMAAEEEATDASAKDTNRLKPFSDMTSVPVPVVSGVLVFPVASVLRSLDLLYLSLSCMDALDGLFRVTWIPSWTWEIHRKGSEHLKTDSVHSKPPLGIERTLEGLLTYNYVDERANRPEDKEMHHSIWPEQKSDINKLEREMRRERRRELKRTQGYQNYLRWSFVRRYVRLVLRAARKIGCDMDATRLSDPKLLETVELEIASSQENDDRTLYQYIEKIRQTEGWLSERSLVGSFGSFIQRQAGLEAALSNALGLRQGISHQNTTADWISPAPLVIVLHGRAIRMERDFSMEDVIEVVRRVLPLSKALYKALQNVDFENLGETPERQADKNSSAARHDRRRIPEQARFLRHDLLQIGFYPARIALLAAVMTQTEEQVGPLLSEADLLPPIPSETSIEQNRQLPSRTMFRARSPSPSVRRRHSFILIIDPARKEAQNILAIAHFLYHSTLAVDLQVYLNPGPSMKPIKSFFRFVGRPRLLFDGKGDVVQPAAVFRHLPLHQTLTVDIVEPESWNVFSLRSEYDLDNIRLADAPNETALISISYRLESLVVSGVLFTPTRPQQKAFHQAAQRLMNSRDPLRRNRWISPPFLTAPNGLPLTVQRYRSEMIADQESTMGPPSASDTLVMSSTGYYQLSTQPGMWLLSIPPGSVAKHFYLSEAEGRRTERDSSWWTLDTLEAFPNPVANGTATSFTASHTHWGQRIPIMVDALYISPLLLTYDRSWAHDLVLEDVLFEDALQQEQVASLHKEIREKYPTKQQKPTLNIFSVASGHLYERFLRMMMVSVANTSTTIEADPRIKFWIIEKFLSPTFKRLLPKMAMRYGFEVGYIHYRWPAWLPRQDEKQRIIWAYKILFLDVLFPLDVDRIIFVDADQTVLTDLHELYQLDFTDNGSLEEQDAEDRFVSKLSGDVGQRKKNITLEEAPTIAMAPFCSGKRKNSETLQYRFWEEDGSFWPSHLIGLPYHISALFLVDLRRFRALHAGDVYRTMYSRLVQDPRSLSNLDQDLPNFLQHQIPIYSLPEEWLWCETWCSSESRKNAKTIDLCNNPLSKRPKWENAKRIIPNWEEMDRELSSLFESFLAEEGSTEEFSATSPPKPERNTEKIGPSHPPPVVPDFIKLLLLNLPCTTQTLQHCLHSHFKVELVLISVDEGCVKLRVYEKTDDCILIRLAQSLYHSLCDTIVLHMCICRDGSDVEGEKHSSEEAPNECRRTENRDAKDCFTSISLSTGDAALVSVAQVSSLVARTTGPGTVIQDWVSQPATRRRLALAAGKAGISIADGMLLSNSALNPAVTAALVMYECARAIQDYRVGELNSLGYPTSKTDVALRIGKEVLCAGVGIGIGQAIGAGLALSTIPVAGQFLITAGISVGLGIFIGALLCRYVDRAFIRYQIRCQYNYPAHEKEAQARFESLMEGLHDLSSIEACRMVQHYMDYRIASGWESISDGDDYRSAGFPDHMLPVSLQHFTAVRLERKWGFMKHRRSCRKLFRALMLEYHPDRGGDPAMAAQLGSDYELYAFCRGWWSDCRSFVRSSLLPENQAREKRSTPASHRNPVWNFFRELFFSSSTNSEILAHDLHAHNFLQLPALITPMTPMTSPQPTRITSNGDEKKMKEEENGCVNESGSTKEHLKTKRFYSLEKPSWKRQFSADTPPSPYSAPSCSETMSSCIPTQRETDSSFENLWARMDKPDKMEGVDDSEDDSASDSPFSTFDGCTVGQQSTAVDRVLSGVRRCYQRTVELINYASLVEVSRDDGVWPYLLSHAENFSCMQSVLHCWTTPDSWTDFPFAEDLELSTETVYWGTPFVVEPPSTCQSKSSPKVDGRTVPITKRLEDVIKSRETSREVLVHSIFSPEVKADLTKALELWRTAKDIVSNYLLHSSRVHGTGRADNNSDGSTTGSVIDTLLAIQRQLTSIQQRVKDTETLIHIPPCSAENCTRERFVLEMKTVGLNGSSALGGEHSLMVRETVKELCQSYLAAWSRKQTTYQTLMNEIQLLRHEEGGKDIPKSSSSTNTSPVTPSTRAATSVYQPLEEVSSLQSQLDVLEQQLAEADAVLEEMKKICFCFLPEYRNELLNTPSTAVWSVLLHSLPPHSHFFRSGTNAESCGNSKWRFGPSRWMEFERERHVSFYTNLEPEPSNLLEPFSSKGLNVVMTVGVSVAETTEEKGVLCIGDDRPILKGEGARFSAHAEIGFRLLRGTYVNPITGKQSYCWLKEYDLRDVCVQLQQPCTCSGEMERRFTDHEIFIQAVAREQIAKIIIDHECFLATRCGSCRVVSPREVFGEAQTCCLYFHLPREETQQRFKSVANISTHLVPFGLNWLHEALQCVLDIHLSGGTGHGTVALSSFMYDSFGHVTIGSFSFPSLRTTKLNKYCRNIQVEKGGLYSFAADTISVVETSMESDAVDFGTMILSEILPFFSAAAKQSDTALNGDFYTVFKEVGERLVAKVEPSFTLRDAQLFVRRYLSAIQLDATRMLPFHSKRSDVGTPPEWGLHPSLDHIHLEPCTLRLTPSSFRAMRVRGAYRNIHLPLWECYQQFREAAAEHQTPVHFPPQVKRSCTPPFLPCDDNLEINECFTWCPCNTPSEAWRVCYHGAGEICGKNKANTFPLQLSHPLYRTPLKQVPPAGQWIVVFRTILGTLVSAKDSDQYLQQKKEVWSLFSAESSEYDEEIIKVSPRSPHACFPEYAVFLGLHTDAETCQNVYPGHLSRCTRYSQRPFCTILENNNKSNETLSLG
eukprot:gene2597-1613_t